MGVQVSWDIPTAIEFLHVLENKIPPFLKKHELESTIQIKNFQTLIFNFIFTASALIPAQASFLGNQPQITPRRRHRARNSQSNHPKIHADQPNLPPRLPRSNPKIQLPTTLQHPTLPILPGIRATNRLAFPPTNPRALPPNSKRDRRAKPGKTPQPAHLHGTPNFLILRSAPAQSAVSCSKTTRWRASGPSATGK